MFSPLVREISYCNPLLLFECFWHQKWALFLDSALVHEHYGRYSYIAVQPFKTIELKDSRLQIDSIPVHQKSNPFVLLKQLLTGFPQDSIAGLPPFQGGAAGAFSYDLYQYLEEIPPHATDFTQFPDLAVGFYDVVISWDHQLKKAWIVSTGWPKLEEEGRLLRAKQRMEAMLQTLEEGAKEVTATPLLASAKVRVSSNFTQKAYEHMVEHVRDSIGAGDIFQANVSQCFKAELPQNLEPFSLYKQLRIQNPAPFAAFFNLDSFQVLSASPERFLQVRNNQVETRPIKGTRPRSKDAKQDACYAQELQNSIKDRAENIMIVDLMRNDLSKVCQDHSVKVVQLCGIESYATVHHLVSVVLGELKNNNHALDLLAAAFPGGSITGAPKIQSMHCIASLEPSKRGLYCGSLGYIGFDGTMDTSIVIRTYVIKGLTVTFQAGGAVVLDSVPTEEYQESLSKAKALFNLLENLA